MRVHPGSCIGLIFSFRYGLTCRPVSISCKRSLTVRFIFHLESTAIFEGILNYAYTTVKSISKYAFKLDKEQKQFSEMQGLSERKRSPSLEQNSSDEQQYQLMTHKKT